MELRWTEWEKQAACAGKPTEMWFPEVSSNARRTKAAIAVENRARRTCALCPVRSECLTEAVKRQEEYGIWGGTMPHERRAVAHNVQCVPGTRANPNACTGCRPVGEQVDILLRKATVYAISHGLVATREVDADEFFGLGSE